MTVCSFGSEARSAPATGPASALSSDSLEDRPSWDVSDGGSRRRSGSAWPGEAAACEAASEDRSTANPSDATCSEGCSAESSGSPAPSSSAKRSRSNRSRAHEPGTTRRPRAGTKPGPARHSPCRFLDRTSSTNVHNRMTIQETCFLISVDVSTRTEMSHTRQTDRTYPSVKSACPPSSE